MRAVAALLLPVASVAAIPRPVADVFLARLAVRGRGDGVSVGACRFGAGSLGEFSARRWFSLRAASRSLSARSARTRRASRVSSRAVMRALVAVVSWSSARWWSARMRAVSSAAAAWACSARVTAAASAWRARVASCSACSARASASATWRAAWSRAALMSGPRSRGPAGCRRRRWRGCWYFRFGGGAEFGESCSRASIRVMAGRRRRRPARGRRVHGRARTRRPCGAGSLRQGGPGRGNALGQRWCGRRIPRLPLTRHHPRRDPAGGMN